MAFLRHFETVTNKLLHSLHTFQQCMIGLNIHLASDRSEQVSERARLEMDAGIAGDSVFFYLGIFLDDLAKAVLYTHLIEPENGLESFGDLKREVPKNNRFASLRPLFDELAKPLSWYDCVLTRGRGIRQRLVHYHDIILFAGTRKADDDPWEAVAYLSNAHLDVPANIVELFKTVFSGLFDWLDRLEPRLANELQGRWPDAEPSEFYSRVRFRVPVVYTSNPFAVPGDYLYLPICDGSDKF